ncbi:MAG: sulfotransferase [Methyloligellaceae bacterium]
MAEIADPGVLERAARAGGLIEDRPDAAQEHFDEALRLERRGDFGAAYSAYKKAATLAPGNFEHWQRLGHCLTQITEAAGAIVAFKRAIALRPDHASLYLGLAQAYYQQGDHRAALAAVDKALALRPDLDLAHLEAGGHYQALGDVERARRSFRRALALNPGLVEARYHLATMGKTAADARADLDELNEIIFSKKMPADQREGGYFTEAKLRERLGDHDGAFESYANGNALVRQRCDFDRAGFVELVDGLIEAFRPDVFETLRHVGSETRTPVFIVGMPRSGSTLVEQIIASHPASWARGEYTKMSRIAGLLVGTRSGVLQYPRDIAAIEARSLELMRDGYLFHLLQGRPPETLRVTDKFLFNFLHLGLIAIFFPKAAVIHCRRDPIDTCLSCYFQKFTHAEAMAFSNDLHDLGLYYRHYERLMDHWRAVLPAPILDVRYEDLVGAQEEKSREIIEFVGLDWDDACLRFHKGKRGVATASAWQVRRPIYTSSVARWHRYEKHLAPLRQALADQPANTTP